MYEANEAPNVSKRDIALNIVAIVIQARLDWSTERIVQQAHHAVDMNHVDFCRVWGLNGG